MMQLYDVHHVELKTFISLSVMQCHYLQNPITAFSVIDKQKSLWFMELKSLIMQKELDIH